MHLYAKFDQNIHVVKELYYKGPGRVFSDMGIFANSFHGYRILFKFFEMDMGYQGPHFQGLSYD